VHRDALPAALRPADRVYLFPSGSLDWDLECVSRALGRDAVVFPSVAAIVDSLAENAQPEDVVLVMSNGGFENIHQRVLDALEEH